MIIKTKILRKALDVLERNIGEIAWGNARHGALFNGTEISLSNGDTEVRIKCEFVELHKQQMLIPCKPLAALVRQVQEDEVHIAYNSQEKKALISFGDSKAILPTFNVEDYPRLYDGHITFDDMSDDALQSIVPALDAVKIGISHEETRWYLNGVHLSKDPDGKPCVVATDGHKMAWHPIKEMPARGEGKIIHKDGIKFVTALKDKLQGFAIDDQLVHFKYEGMVVSTSVIKGRFPEWLKVIPQGTKPTFTVKRGHLEQAVMRLMAVKPPYIETTTAVHISHYDDKFRLFSEWSDFPAETKVPRETHVENDQLFDIGFSGRYIMQVMHSFPQSKKVTFHMGEARNPVIITGDDSDLKVVLMYMVAHGPSANSFSI